MLFWAAVCLLIGLLGMGVCGILLVTRISDSLADSDAEHYGR